MTTVKEQEKRNKKMLLRFLSDALASAGAKGIRIHNASMELKRDQGPGGFFVNNGRHRVEITFEFTEPAPKRAKGCTCYDADEGPCPVHTVKEPLRPGECGAIGPDKSHCDRREGHKGKCAWNYAFL